MTCDLLRTPMLTCDLALRSLLYNNNWASIREHKLTNQTFLNESLTNEKHYLKSQSKPKNNLPHLISLHPVQDNQTEYHIQANSI